MKKIFKKILKLFLVLLLVFVVVVGGYVGYVFISFNRIEDNQELEIKKETVNEKALINQEYSIVSYNIGFGAYTQDFTFFLDGGHESWARSKGSVINMVNNAGNYVKNINPDFVTFQEVDFNSTRTYHVNQETILADIFNSYTYTTAVNYNSPFLMYPFYQPHGKSNSGIVTFSNVKINSGLRRSLPVSTSLSKLVDLDRCYSKARINTANGKELIIYNAHLSAYGHSDEIRNAQMTMLFEDMKAEYDAGNYCVCGGDFNHDFTGDSIKVLNEGKDAESNFDWAYPFPSDLLLKYEGISRALNYSCGYELPTCRNCDVPYVEGNFTIIVDGFLVSDNVSVTYLENMQTSFLFSDHNPVFMKFKLI